MRNPDGTLRFGCPGINGKWLGPDARVIVTANIGLPTSPANSVSGEVIAEVIAKVPVIAAHDGCPAVQNDNKHATKILDLGRQHVDKPVSSPDGTKLALFNSNSLGGSSASTATVNLPGFLSPG